MVTTSTHHIDKETALKNLWKFLKSSGVDLSNRGSLQEHAQFQEYLSEYKIVVFSGLSPDKIIFIGNFVSSKKLFLLYNADTKHYNVITIIMAAMAKKYLCNACDALYDFKHKCDKTCSLCTNAPPCTKDKTKYCSTCSRWFLSEKCFQNHLVLRVKGKLFCQWRQICRNSNFLVTSDNKHKCFKNFVVTAINYNPLAIFATWLRWNLASWQTDFCIFSLIRSVHETLKGVMGLLNISRTSYVPSRCDLSVKPWMI
jgi:hypothetical protein